MVTRRAALAVSVLLILASGTAGLVPARAGTVTDAEERADSARTEASRAYRIVSEAVDDQEALELELFDALARYEDAVAELALANQQLERVARALAAAEAGAAGVSLALEQQAVSAYMDAVANPASMVVTTGNVVQVMVYDQARGEDQAAEFAELQGLTAQKAELDRLRIDFEAERDRVDVLQRQLDAEAGELERLFDRANEAVAAAYRRAAEADADYQAALSDVDRARAAEEERRRQAAAAAATTTTTAPAATTTTGGNVGGGTTTTTPTAPTPRPGIMAAVERWRPIVAAHFPADLVEDALYIIQCESNGDPEAVNPYSGAAGLFQFLPGTWAVASVNAGVPDASVLDPEPNIQAAAWLAGYYQANGRSPWSGWACRWYLG
jgi:peptidoglycan hydrolase CwlO-like protein